MMNYVDLAKELINFKSITPHSAGCIEYLAKLLQDLEFTCHVVKFGPEGEEVTNLYAIYQKGGKNICFAGHIDVVPTGPEEKWKYPPFEATIEGDKLYGRGAVDMKGAIAAMVFAAADVVKNLQPDQGSISFLITSDEEGPAKYGVKKMIPWLEENGQQIDFCLIGEPTYKNTFGDVIQIGRRGSASFLLTVYGKQGHVAYDNFINPLNIAVTILNDLIPLEPDAGMGASTFTPSKLNVTSIDCNNSVTNIVPESAQVRFNIRYNTLHTVDSLHQMCTKIIANYCDKFTLELVEESPTPFLSDVDNNYVQHFKKIVFDKTRQEPKFTTYGGASDGRFISKICQVIEFGLASSTAHQINEYLFLSDLQKLYGVYHDFLVQCFSTHAIGVDK